MFSIYFDYMQIFKHIKYVKLTYILLLIIYIKQRLGVTISLDNIN